MFPLQTVLLPGVHLPLHIFEPRYRQLTIDLVTAAVPDRQFGVIGVKTALVREVESLEHVQRVGCSTLLREAKRLADGRFDIVTTGQRRFRLLELETCAKPYLLGTVEWLPDENPPPGSGDAATRLSEVARAAHRRYCESAWEREDWTIPPIQTPIEELAYALASDCLLAVEDRQRLLEERHPLRRLRMVCRLLTREAGFLSALRAVPAPPSELPGMSKPASLN